MVRGWHVTARITGTTKQGHPYVLECDCYPKTYGLGKVQRRVVDYLATAPGRFAGMSWDPDTQRFTWHGRPNGVTVHQVAIAVYGTDEPTASQVRVIQRGVRRLESLGLVDCWHGWTGVMREGAYVTSNGFSADMPVSALFVALRWECEHMDGGDTWESA